MSGQTPAIEQSQVQATSLAHRSISEDATLTHLPLSNTVLAVQTQSASHAVSNQGTTTTKPLLPSSSPAKQSLSTTSVLPYSSNIGPSVSASGKT